MAKSPDSFERLHSILVRRLPVTIVRTTQVVADVKAKLEVQHRIDRYALPRFTIRVSAEVFWRTAVNFAVEKEVFRTLGTNALPEPFGDKILSQPSPLASPRTSTVLRRWVEIPEADVRIHVGLESHLDRKGHLHTQNQNAANATGNELGPHDQTSRSLFRNDTSISRILAPPGRE